MMPSNELYDLVKSLTGSEKRYFRLNASKQKGNKNYLKLFDAVDTQKIFDEAAIKRKFRNESFIKNITVTKNYLYNLIFKSLISYHEKKSVDVKLGNLLFSCKLMFEKSLYKQFFKSLVSGKELAYRTERFSYILEFIEFEKQIMKRDKIGKKNMNEVYDEELSVLEIIKEINICKRAISNLFRLLRTKGAIRDSSDEKKIDEIISSTGFETDTRSAKAKESIYLAGYLEFRLKGNYEKAIHFCKKRYELISGNSQIFKNFLLDPALDSLEFNISSALSLDNFIDAGKIFKRYKKISSICRNEGNVRIIDYDIRLSKAIVCKDERASEDLIPELEKFIAGNKGKILVNTENYFYYNITKYFFVTANFIEALRTINDHLSSKSSKLTPEFESYQRILNIMIHYELGNYNLLKYLIPSAKKFLAGKKKLFEFETAVLKFIGVIIQPKATKNFDELLKEFKEEVSNLRKNKYEKNAFGYFDLSDWVDGKINSLKKYN
jgi:hypothetical protein